MEKNNEVVATEVLENERCFITIRSPSPEAVENYSLQNILHKFREIEFAEKNERVMLRDHSICSMENSSAIDLLGDLDLHQTSWYDEDVLLETSEPPNEENSSFLRAVTPRQTERDEESDKLKTIFANELQIQKNESSLHFIPKRCPSPDPIVDMNSSDTLKEERDAESTEPPRENSAVENSILNFEEENWNSILDEMDQHQSSVYENSEYDAENGIFIGERELTPEVLIYFSRRPTGRRALTKNARAERCQNM